MVDSFVYLGSSVDASGGNDSDIRRRIELARTCMKLLDRGIWHSGAPQYHWLPSSGFTIIIIIIIIRAFVRRTMSASELNLRQCLYSSGAPVWLGHMECDRSVETAS